MYFPYLINESLKILTGQRQTIWLYAKHSQRVESNEQQDGGLKPRTTRLQVQHPNHLDTLPPQSFSSMPQKCISCKDLIIALHHFSIFFFLRRYNMIAQYRIGSGRTVGSVLAMLNRVDVTRHYPQVGNHIFLLWATMQLSYQGGVNITSL